MQSGRDDRSSIGATNLKNRILRFSLITFFSLIIFAFLFLVLSASGFISPQANRVSLFILFLAGAFLIFSFFIIRFIRFLDAFIKKNEENYLDTLTSLGEAVITTDEQGRIVSMNSTAAKLTGWDIQAALGLEIRVVYHVLHPATRETQENPVLRILKTEEKKVRTRSLILVNQQGEEVAISQNVSSILDWENRVTGVILVFRDETEDNEKKQQLQRIQHVLDFAPEEIFLADRTGKLIFANRKIQNRPEFLGKEAGELTVFDVLPALTPEFFREEQLQLAMGGRVHQEFSRRDSNGSRNYFERYSFLVSRGAEQIQCVFIHDMTEQKHLESQLFQGQKLQALGQLVGGVAHDFNNLLCGIIGYSEILIKRLGENPENGKYAHTILTTAQRAASLTTQLLAFSRNREYALEYMNIHDCINDTVRLLKRSVDKKIVIKKKLNPGTATINGNYNQLQNAFLNLCLNARDAMPEGGVLKINSELVHLPDGEVDFSSAELPSGDYRLIRFTDNGTGIPEENLQRIFEPFYTTKKMGEGTGLGLSAVYGTVKKHKGELSVSSRLGEGAEFRVLLPVDAQTLSTPALLLPENPAKLFSGTVLVVDDEIVLTDMLKQYLEEKGFRTFSAENGLTALKIFMELKKEIDCVILDIVMPEMDGFTALKKMKEADPDVNVIMVSGFTGEDRPEKCIEMGARAFLHKPYRMQNLLDVLTEIIPV